MPNKSGKSGEQKSAGALILALAIWAIPLVGLGLALRLRLPHLASEHGASIDRLFHYLFITVGSMLLVGHAVLGYVVLRAGQAKHVSTMLPSPKRERNWSLWPALAMALVAEGGVVVLGLPAWEKVYGADAPQDAITVEVTAEQFAWNVRYPGKDGVFGLTAAKLISLDNPLGRDATDASGKDDLVFLNEIWTAVSTPTHIRLRSKDVIHSFFLPNFRFKQDAVPGMTMDFWFVPTEVGDFEIACTELCGMGHYQMKGLIHVLTKQDYDKWLNEQTPSP